MKKIFCFLFFICTFLFSLDLKVYNTNLDLDKIIYVKSLKEINFSKDVALLPATLTDFVINNKLVIIGGFDKAQRYILLNKQIKKVKTIANVDLIAKIFLKTLKKNDFIFKRATLKDFLENKVDAIVTNKYIPNKNIIVINLGIFGLNFNKFILVTSKKVVDSDSKKLFEIKNRVSLKYSLEDKLVFNELFHTGYYLNKKINYTDYIFKSIKLHTDFYKVVVTPNWQPFDIYKDGIIKGIGIDMFKLIAKKINLNYKFYFEKHWSELINDFKLGIYDITPNTSKTSDRTFAIFTKPYMEFPLAVVCRKNDNITSIEQIKNIAVGENFTAHKMMLKYYPNLNYILEKSIKNVLEDVKNKKAQCGVDILPVIAYNIQKGGFNNLEIKFLTPFTFKLQIMLRKGLEDLRDKFNMIIDSISSKQKQEIINKYINLAVIEKVKIPLWFYGLIVIFILVIILFVFYKIKSDKEANIDELTLAYNRRFLANFMEKNKKNKFSLIYFDIDHFKKINDTFGHDFGDFVLKELANLIKSHIREGDILIRLGGEEFLIIFPNVEYKKALKIAEKLRSIVENYNFKGIKITSSFGVAFKDKNDSFKEIIKKADEAMYNAKKNGRNQVKGYK